MIPRSKLLISPVLPPLFLSGVVALALASVPVVALRSVKVDDPPAAANGHSATVEKSSAPQEDHQKERQSQNRHKQLVLAMHNYHDVYGHFPPAVLVGSDGKTPHSW